MNGFVGDGITRDGLELVGERYGVCYVMCTTSFLVLYLRCVELMLVYSFEYVIILMCPCVPFLDVFSQCISLRLALVFCFLKRKSGGRYVVNKTLFESLRVRGTRREDFLEGGKWNGRKDISVTWIGGLAFLHNTKFFHKLGKLKNCIELRVKKGLDKFFKFNLCYNTLIIKNILEINIHLSFFTKAPS